MADVLSTEVSVVGDRVAVRVRGEIDLASAPDARDALHAAVDCAVSTGVDLVLVDVGGVAFFDLNGLRAFEEAQRRAAEAGCRLVLAHVSPSVALVLEHTAHAGSLVGGDRAPDGAGLLPVLARAMRAAAVPIGVALSIAGSGCVVDSFVGTEESFATGLAAVVADAAASGHWPARPTGVWIGDLAAVPGATAAPEGRFLITRGIRAVCTRPLYRADALVGIVLLYDREPRRWSPELRRAVELATDGG